MSKAEHNDITALEFLQSLTDSLNSPDIAPYADWRAMTESEHFVQFYETDAFLMDSLSGFIAAGLSAGETSIVVATEEHRKQLDERLQAMDMDPAAAQKRGQYLSLDADEMLQKLLVNGLPESGRFTEYVGNLVVKATRNRGRVRIFGEMVAILWARGNQNAAIQLEELWNCLHKNHPFLLFCGYPINSFAEPAFIESIGRVCAKHSRVIPAESYTSLTRPEDRLRAITLLQQKANALQAKLLESKNTEAQLLASEDRYRHLFDSSADGILIIDPDSHNISDANPAMSAMLGIPLHEIKGKTLGQIGLLEGDEANSQLWRELKEKQVVHYEHLTLNSTNGTSIYIDFICNRYQINNTPVIQCNIRDINERRGAEQLSLHLAAIVESSDDAIISKSLDGTILSWNKGAERIFGYTSEEIIGKPIIKLIPPDSLDEETHIIEQLKQGNRIDHYETVRIAKDGSKVDISLSVSPIKDKSGKIVAASKVARNITERKQAERRLREQAEIIEIINRTGQRLSADLNLQNVIQTVTDASTELTGAQLGAFFYNIEDKARESLKHYTFSGRYRDAFTDIPLPQNTDLFASGFGAEGSLRIDDVKQNQRDGFLSPFHHLPADQLPVTSYMAVPVLSSSGELLGGLFFAHRLAGVFTERHQRIVEGIAGQAAIALDNAKLYELSQQERAKAEEANRLKDEFLATVSHELRTPLNAIIGWAHMLQKGNLNEATTTHAIETIERNARSQAQLIEDILDVSRIITGKLRLREESVDIISIITAAIDSVQLAADAKGIRLSVILDPSVRHLSGDANRLQQIIWNILSNAIKFTGADGRVEVRLERSGATAQIVVKDTGQGISKEFLPYIFERFRQADGTTTRRHGGLGLGLAIVRHLVEVHGGTVQAQSEGEGTGATFIINLPLSPHSNRAKYFNRALGTPIAYQEQDGRNRVLPSLAGIEVVVVDDDPDTLEMLTAMLIECGATVRAATSAAEALETLQFHRPDVLVSDLAMPQEDGYSLIGKIRAAEAPNSPQLPAVALTAYVRIEDRARALSAGFNMFVPKPIEPIELISAIANLATAAPL